MRDIKFRVWCQDKNEWEESFVVLLQEGIVCHVINGQLKIIRPERHIVEFYTGLKDSKGREIYEGDIIEFFDVTGGYMNSEVFFEDGGFSVKANDEYMPFLGETNGWKIIGNIHENPELLK